MRSDHRESLATVTSNGVLEGMPGIPGKIGAAGLEPALPVLSSEGD